MKPFGKTIQQVLAEPRDFELCDGLFLHIMARTSNRIDANRLNETERVVVLTWHANGIIGNGGFEYLFETAIPSDPSFAFTEHAFRQVGLPQAAQVIADALAMLPLDSTPKTADQRLDQYNALPEAKRDALNDAYWQFSSELPATLAAFIRSRKHDFRRL